MEHQQQLMYSLKNGIKMTLFDKPTGTTSVPELTDEQKALVYDGLKADLSYVKIKQLVNHINGKNFAMTMKKDLNVFESQVRSYMNGSVLVTPEILDDEGIVDTPAVYNTKPATLVVLKAFDYVLGVLSGVKDSDVLVDEVVDYATTAGTWTAYKDSFTSEE